MYVPDSFDIRICSVLEKYFCHFNLLSHDRKVKRWMFRSFCSHCINFVLQETPYLVNITFITEFG